jgi:hypothetical protein
MLTCEPKLNCSTRLYLDCQVQTGTRRKTLIVLSSSRRETSIFGGRFVDPEATKCPARRQAKDQQRDRRPDQKYRNDMSSQTRNNPRRQLIGVGSLVCGVNDRRGIV